MHFVTQCSSASFRLDSSFQCRLLSKKDTWVKTGVERCSSYKKFHKEATCLKSISIYISQIDISKAPICRKQRNSYSVMLGMPDVLFQWREKLCLFQSYNEINWNDGGDIWELDFRVY